jgi:alpha-galactosidase
MTTLSIGVGGSAGQQLPARVAATPPMGWNSWDSYGLTVTETQFRDNVNVLTSRLKPFGWTYAVVDEGWFFFNPQDREHPDLLQYAIDSHGRYVPVPARFPSALVAGAHAGVPGVDGAAKMPAAIEETSFRPLSSWVHAQGLQFGIHIVRGIPRASVERNLPIAGSSFNAQDAADTSDACSWDPTNWGVKDNAAGQAWYDSLIHQYADWGVDLLKVDCISANPYAIGEIRMIRRAIDKTGRPMVLSLSPGPTALAHASELIELANMWRISNDIWDIWSSERPFPISVKSQFARLAGWAKYAGPGHWPDADMLPLGYLGPVPGYGKPRSTNLTPDEQRTMLTLWSIGRSPLIVGANLTRLDSATEKLLTNRDVIAVDQMATSSRQVFNSDGLIAWSADLPSDFPGGFTMALAVFNTADTTANVNSGFDSYGLPAGTYTAKDAWTGNSAGRVSGMQNLSLAPHASVLWLLRR